MQATVSFAFLLSCTAWLAGGSGPPLQLESYVSDVTNLVKDRDYAEFYDTYIPKKPFQESQLKPAERLGRRVVPLHYSIQTRPILDQDDQEGKRLTAPGRVKILFKCLEPTETVVVNAVDMEILDDSIESKVPDIKGKSVSVKSREHTKDDGVYTIRLDQICEPESEHELTINYIAKVSDQRLVGLYYTNFTDPSGKLHHIATTQFESTHARKAFPCFDEPDLKATFDVTVGRKAHYNSVSNAELKSTEPISGLEGWFWDHYKTTPKMSTYLVAFVVSEHVADEAVFGKRVIRTWAPKHLIENKSGAYATQIAGRALDFYESYFEIPYPLPKMDSVAIPHFRAGAMENWGLNTYRYKSLLYNKNQSTEAEKFGATATISHELAHQNFGNLVTCKKWSHIWLNEGFATYVSYLGLGSVAPELKAWDYFYTRETAPAMRLDSGASSHALVNNSAANALTTGDFDKISYGKGASILLMLRGILGEETMQKIFQVYLKKYAMKTSLTEDFIAEADSIAAIDERLPQGLSVKKILDSYLYQRGLALVKVSQVKGNPSKLRITQEKFVKNRTQETEPTSGDLWWIPVSVKYSSEPNFDDHKPNLWLPDDVVSKHYKIPTSRGAMVNASLEGPLNYDWVVVNHAGYGYYRVIYDDKLTKLLQKQLETDHTIFPPVTRAKLIEDYFHAAKAEYIPYSTALSFTNYLARETDHSVWSVSLLNLKQIHNLMRGGKRFDLFAAYFKPKLVSALKTIGYEQSSDDSGPDVMLRANLMDWACNLGHRESVEYSKRLFKSWMDGVKLGLRENPIPADLRSVVMCTAIARASHVDKNYIFLFLWNQYKAEKDSAKKTQLIEAMACSQDKKHLNFMIDSALSHKSNVGVGDSTVALQRLAANSIGHGLVIERLHANLTSFIDKLGGAQQIGYILTALSVYATTGNHVQALQTLLEKNPEFFRPIIQLVFAAISNAATNIGWVSKFEQAIASWFETRIHDPDTDLLLF